MIGLLAVPVLIGITLCLVADPLARSLRPGWAAPLLTGLALSVALCTGIALSVAAVLVGMQAGPFPRLGRWSAGFLRARMGFPDYVGVLAMALVAAALAAALVRAVRTVRLLVRSSRQANRLHPAAGPLVVVDDAVPIAYSLLGAPGRIVVSTAMFAALSAGERRVLLAHEGSHLRHKHHVYLHLTRLAAAANPLLRPVVGAVARAVERAADEDAAADVGDRSLTARALAHAAMARGGQLAQPEAALAAADERVLERVQFLLAPPLRYRPLPIAGVLLAGVLSWATAVTLAAWGNGLVQAAEAMYPRR